MYWTESCHLILPQTAFVIETISGVFSDERHDKASKFFPVSASVNLAIFITPLSLLRMREITFVFTPHVAPKLSLVIGKEIQSAESVESIGGWVVFPFDFWGWEELSLIPKRKYFLCETPWSFTVRWQLHTIWVVLHADMSAGNRNFSQSEWLIFLLC